MQQNMIGPNIIITEPSSNLRALGRNALAGKWKLAILAVIVYTLCIDVPPVILNSLFGINIGDMYYNYGYDGMYYQYSYVYDSMPTYSSLSGIYLILVTGAFTLGITLFFLALFRRQIVGIGDIFLGFERFGKALGLMLFQSLFIFLWSLLLIVPGVIASIRYSQAFFILADDPNKGIRECMDESKRMMAGNKWKYFCLDISFIGWFCLAIIPASILSAIASVLYFSAFVTVLISILGSLFLVPVIAYRYATMAGFYEILAGHLIKETEPAPIEPEAIPVESMAQTVDNISADEEVHDNKDDGYDVTEEMVSEASNDTSKGKSDLKTVDVATVFAEVDKEGSIDSEKSNSSSDKKDGDDDSLPKQVD